MNAGWRNFSPPQQVLLEITAEKLRFAPDALFGTEEPGGLAENCRSGSGSAAGLPLFPAGPVPVKPQPLPVFTSGGTGAIRR